MAYNNMLVRANQLLLGTTPKRYFSSNPFQEEFGLKLKENFRLITWYRRFQKMSRRRGRPIYKITAAAVFVLLTLLLLPGNKITMQTELKSAWF